jgi:predicted secreted protein
VSVLRLPLNKIPAVLRESAFCVLNAHGYKLVDRDGQPLDADQAEAVLHELSRNGAQALVSLDMDPEPSGGGSNNT